MTVPIRGRFVALLVFAVLIAVIPLATPGRGAAASPTLRVVDASSADGVNSPAATLTVPRTALTAVEITAGQSHNCARFGNGSVKCWGWNLIGQLGLGDASNRGDGPNEMGDTLPGVYLGPGRTAVKLAAGFQHTCALLDNGAVKCWGNNGSGRLGLGHTLARGDGPGEMGNDLPTVDLGTGLTAVELTAGGSHTCARLNNSTVKCWGHNGEGRLGLGDTLARGDQPNEMGNALLPVNLGTGLTAVELAAGNEHTCARLNTGAVKCWGRNEDGRLGLGNTDNRGDGVGLMGNDLPTVDLGTGLTAVGLRAGFKHTCARLNTGAVKCWGGNTFGELGLGDTVRRGDGAGLMGNDLPAVELGGTAVELTAGWNHTCARLDTGAVKCWGINGNGELGLGHTLTRGDGPNEMGGFLLAVDLGPGRTAVKLAAGSNHTCALLDNGAVKCWGHNGNGQLGLGDTLHRGDAPNEMGDALLAVDLGSAPEPFPGPPIITLASSGGATGEVYLGTAFSLTAPPLREPGPLPDVVSAIFSWNNAGQQFNFWFRGFPNSFQTLTTISPGNYYFFQSTGAGTIGNTGGGATLSASGAVSITTVAGANGAIWSGQAHLVGTLGAYPSIQQVTAIFSWNNTNQQFNFWFRGFPNNFQTLTAGIERGKYYFFQAPLGHTLLMD